MLVRGDRLTKSMSAYLIDRIEAHPLIDVHLETADHELHADGDAHRASPSPTRDGKAETEPVDGVFLCIGGSPHTDWCPREHVLTDAQRLHPDRAGLIADERFPGKCWTLDRDPFPLETSRVGLFAAGDVRHGSTKRVGAAVGEGAMVAALAFQRLAELGVTSELVRAARAHRAAARRLTDEQLTTQYSPLQSPLVWDLAHIGYFEELWLLGRRR